MGWYNITLCGLVAVDLSVFLWWVDVAFWGGMDVAIGCQFLEFGVLVLCWCDYFGGFGV